MTFLMVEFLRPQRLWALLIIVGLFAIYAILSSKGSSRSSSMSSRLKRVVPKDSVWKRHGAVTLACLSLAALVLAWAMPKDFADRPRERASVIVAIDVSWSMEAEDVDPNRLQAAQSAAKNFVDTLPPQFNVALVSFAGTANIEVPPTTDRSVVKAGIDQLVLAPSTATGEAIYMSLEALKLVPPNPDDPDAVAPAAIVLLGDGATNMGRNSFDAAAAAKEVNVPIYTIAYGTANGFVEAGGQRQTVAVDHFEMSEIAKRSGGVKFSAESGGQLREVYQRISSDIGTEKVEMEVTDRYAGYALWLAIAAALGVISLGARWP